MDWPGDELGNLKSYRYAVKLFLREAECSVRANGRRELCVIAEEMVRDLHRRGLRPQIVAQCHGATNRLWIERYLEGVVRELATR